MTPAGMGMTPAEMGDVRAVVIGIVLLGLVCVYYDWKANQ